MRPLNEIVAVNANASGISVQENMRISSSNQYLKKIDGKIISVSPVKHKGDRSSHDRAVTEDRHLTFVIDICAES